MINKSKLSLSLLLALGLLLIQVGGVFAAPVVQDSTPFQGVVQSITLEADTITGVTIVSIDVMDADQSVQTVRLSQESAIALGLILVDSDGNPTINDLALGKAVEIEAAQTIPAQEENQHPVASALATFFSDIPGIDYETIMSAHGEGIGFGVIAQALWLTTKLEGDAEIFETLIEAKQSGDFSAFILEDGSSPQNWGQLKKAILNGGKNNGLGVVISNSHPGGNGGGNGQGNHGNDPGNGSGNGGSNGNHGNGSGNGGGNGNGNRNSGNGNGKE